MKRKHLIAGLVLLFSLSSTASFATLSTGHLFRVVVAAPPGLTGINGFPLTRL